MRYIGVIMAQFISVCIVFPPTWLWW